MMDIELRYVPIAEDYMPNMKKMRSKIDKNTIMLVASAPQYPQGKYILVMDSVLLEIVILYTKILPGKVVLWCFFSSKMSEKIHNSTFHVKIISVDNVLMFSK